MKNIQFILIALICITNSYANPISMFGNTELMSENKKSGTVQKFQLDSVISHNFSSSQNEIVPVRKNVFKYHQNGDVAVEELYLWEYSNINNTYVWRGNTRKEYTYINDKPFEFISSSWNWNTLDWRYTEKNTYEYNEKGQKTKEYLSKWNWYISNEWGNTHKNEFDYDENGNVISHARFSWDTDSSIWGCYQKEEFEFDENSILLNYTNNKIELPGQPIIKTYREEYNNDVNGQLILKMQFMWDKSKEEWKEAYKTENIYRPDGKITYNAVYNFNTISNQWDKVLYTDYSYNNMGLLTLQKNMYWDTDSSKYLINNISEYDFDTDGFPIFFLSLSRNSFTKLLSGMKREITTDPIDGSKITIHYSWDNQTSQFIKSSKTVTRYNNEKFTSELSYYWDNQTEEFKPSNLSENFYDEKNNFILQKRFQYNNSGEWIQYSYTENEYNLLVSEEDIICPESFRSKLKYQLLKEEYLSQMFSKVMTRTTYHYSPFTYTSIPAIAEADFRLYPNPVTNHLFIDFDPSKGNVLFELFDIQGSGIMNRNLTGNQSVHLGELKSGFYIYRLSQQGNIQTGKLIKQ
jgi:hypothetical protein